MSIDDEGRRAAAALKDHRPPMTVPDPASVATAVARRRAARRVAGSGLAALAVAAALVVWQVQRPSARTTVNVGNAVTTVLDPATTILPTPTTVTPLGGGRGPRHHTTSTTTTPPVPTTIGPQPFSFGTITFHLPSDWQHFSQDNTAYVGTIAASGVRLLTLRVQLGYSGAIDAVAPTTCVGRSDWNPPVTSVVVARSGFAPVGDRTAQFRDWAIHCDAANGPGDLKSPTPIDQHLRAWYLPVSKVIIVEQVPPTPPGDAALAVVTTATVR